MKSCSLCQVLWDRKEVYRDQPEEFFVVLGLGRSRVITVVMKSHEGEWTPQEKTSALVVLKEIASRRFGNQYYLEKVGEKHWAFSARRLKVA